MTSEYNVQPKQYCYYPILYHYARHNQQEKVEQTLKELHAHNLPQDQETLCTLISGFSKNNEKRMVRKYLGNLKKLRPWSTNVHEIVIRAYLQMYEIKTALQEMIELKERGYNMSALYNKAIACCMKSGYIEQAKTLCDEMERSDSPQLAVSAATYCSMISEFAKAGNEEETNDLLEKMRERNFHIDRAVSTALLIGHIFNHRFDNASKALQDMKDTVGVDGRLYDSVIKAYIQANRIRSAFEMFGECNASGFTLSRPTYSALIQCVIKSNIDTEEKLNLIETLNTQMEQDGYVRYHFRDSEEKLLSSKGQNAGEIKS